MSLNKVFLPAVDQTSRAINNLSMSADTELRSLEARIAQLEELIEDLTDRVEVLEGP